MKKLFLILTLIAFIGCSLLSPKKVGQRVTVRSEEAYVYPNMDYEYCKKVKVNILITFTETVAIIDEKEQRPMVLRLGEKLGDQKMGPNLIMKGRNATDGSGSPCIFAVGYEGSKIVTVAVSGKVSLIVYIISDKDKSRL